MKVQFRHVGTYIGANPFAACKATIFEIIGISADDTLYVYDRLAEVGAALPHDFKIRLPQAAEEIFDSIAAFVLEFLNYVRGEVKFCHIIKKEKARFIVCDYHEPKVVIEVLKFTGWLFHVSKLNGLEVLDIANRLWDLCQRDHPDYQASFLISHAVNSGLFYSYLGKKQWLYGTGSGSSIFFESSPIEDISLHNTKLSKTGCKSYFQSNGAPTPKYITAYSVEEAIRKSLALKFPVAVKPDDGGRGVGVTAKVSSVEEVRAAFFFAKRARKNKKTPILIEEHIAGSEHRLTLIDHKLVGVTIRIPPFVLGNGVDSIRKLISKKSLERTRNLKASKYLRSIRLDDNVVTTLRLQGYALDDILENGKKVVVRDNSNVSSGGTRHPVVEVNSGVREIAERVSKSVGAKVIGIDYIANDITKPPSVEECGFIEINGTPGIELILDLGLTHTEIGAKILQDCANSAYVEVRILSKLAIQKNIERHAPQDALILPNFFFSKGVFQRLGDTCSILTRIALYLRLKNNIKFIYLTDEFALEAGVPILPNSKIYLARNAMPNLVNMLVAHKINYDFLD